MGDYMVKTKEVLGLFVAQMRRRRRRPNLNLLSRPPPNLKRTRVPRRRRRRIRRLPSKCLFVAVCPSRCDRKTKILSNCSNKKFNEGLNKYFSIVIQRRSKIAKDFFYCIGDQR